SQEWHGLRTAYSQRLSWKLAFSHLQVTVFAQIINVIGIGLIFIFAGRAPTSPAGDDVIVSGAIVAVIFFLGILVLLVTMLSIAAAADLAVHVARRFGRGLQVRALAPEAITGGDISTRV